MADEWIFGEDLDDDVAEPERRHLADGFSNEQPQIARLSGFGSPLILDESAGDAQARVDHVESLSIALIGPLPRSSSQPRGVADRCCQGVAQLVPELTVR